ncbi:MAG: NeuD/PglB/VioB family sugar acetyltransferase [Planctomycetota bacterium]
MVHIVDIVVLGAGGNSLAIVDAIEAINAKTTASNELPRYRVFGFLDDLRENRDRSVLGYPVLGTIADASKFPECRFINGISSVESFRKIPEIIGRCGIALDRFETIIHPSATISAHATIGRGTCIMAGSVVCPEARLGNHVIVLQNTTMNHHARVSDHCTLSAGITVLGYVDIGNNAFIGGGSSIAPFVKVGAGALIGMGSNVIRDVSPGSVIAGNPAKPIPASRHAV